MKKNIFVLITVFVLLMVCLCFTACDPGTKYLDSEIYYNDVVSVELINYENPDQKHFFSWVPDQYSKLISFKNDSYSVIETLSIDKTKAFLAELSSAPILSKYYAYNSPNGICLKVNYTNGDFQIVNCCNANSYAGYIGKYSAGGAVSDFYGCFSSSYSFISLVNCYFEYKMPVKVYPLDDAFRSYEVERGEWLIQTEIKEKNVVSIDLIDYDNPDQKPRSYYLTEGKPFEQKSFQTEKAIVLASLEESRQQEFVDKMKTTEYLVPYGSYNSPKGICIRVNFSTGSYLIINGNADRPNFSGFIADYSADGEMMHNYGSFDTYQSFVDLVNDYFGEEFFATEQE